jgi:hypothetical protein
MVRRQQLSWRSAAREMIRETALPARLLDHIRVVESVTPRQVDLSSELGLFVS